MGGQHHPRRAWFAVWRWPWWAFLPLMPVVYFFTAVPAMSMLVVIGFRTPCTLTSAVDSFYRPALWCAKNSPVLAEIWDRQCLFMLKHTGSCVYSINELDYSQLGKIFPHQVITPAAHSRD